jgi:sortase A
MNHLTILSFPRWGKVADRPDEGLSTRKDFDIEFVQSPSSALRAPSPYGGRVTFQNVIAGILMGGSLLLFGNSIYIYAKAQLAQVLLERAFSQSLLTGKPVKAWSWADTYPVARISVDRINAEAIVLQGASGEALAFGPALLNETSRPGERGTSVMAAHRDTHFAFLQDVKPGDLIKVKRDDGLEFNYRATRMRVVEANHSGINRHASGFHLVLSTCYPFDAITHGSQRYLVEAELVR